MKLLNFWKRIEPSKKDAPLAHTAYDAFFTFFFKPNLTTKGKGVHIRDAMDLKRTMVHVVMMLGLCYVFGAYNIGHQHFLALGVHTGIMDALHLKFLYGLIQILPIFVVSNAVGLGIEFYFAAKKGHAVEEGYLVSGALIPLVMPPDVPLWMLTLSIIFAVVLGKEAFGGTGMNVLNVALLARVFIFFAYPAEISGDGPWIAGIAMEGDAGTASYHFGHLMFNGFFDAMGWASFQQGMPTVQGFSGATPLSVASAEGWQQLDATGKVVGGLLNEYSVTQMFVGGIPGSIGETSKPLIILGGIFLMVTGVASWRIIVGMTLGIIFTGLLFNLFPLPNFPQTQVPWYVHFFMGSALFAMVYMATDPVTAPGTNTGKWIYGFLIGFFGLIIRVLNLAYAEGWMLAILLMNVFSPVIDYYVLESNISKRMKRAKYAKQ